MGSQFPSTLTPATMPKSNESQQSDAARADIGIVCGLAIEMNAFLSRCARVRNYTGDHFTFRGGIFNESRIVVVETGHGPISARLATQSLIAGHSPDWVLSCGFSGSLIPDLSIGDVVVANTILDTDGNQISLNVNMQAGPGLKVGRCVVTDKLVRTVDHKKQLATDHKAIACDTQSLAVAQVCRDQGCRFMSIRTISDDLSADLPNEILSVIGSTGSQRLGAALGSIWKRPGSVKDMWYLRENAISAAERLAGFLEGVVAQLGTSHKK
jgi:adenosylhomocysteine nucleosidase